MRIKLSDHFTYGRLIRFCLSPMIMMIFTSIYGVVDGLFVSNYVGKIPFASINLVMPFLMMVGGIGFMLGTGGSALTAMTLGEGDQERANRYFSMIVLFTVICGISATVLGIVFLPDIVRLLGATEVMMEDCLVYGRISMAFTTPFMLQSVFHTFLTTAEKPKLGLMATVAAGVTNMVLDALFVVVFDWGVAGAALATGISESVGGFLPLVYFLRPNDSLLRLRRVRLELRPLVLSCTNGASELMSSISSSLVGVVYNYQLLRFAGEDGVAVYGILMYVQFIFVAIFIGYTIGTAPVVGYHYGADNREELKNVLRKSVCLNGLAGVVMLVLGRTGAGLFARIFVGYDAGLVDMTVHAFHIFAFGFLLAGYNIFVSSFFTALNNGAVSAAVSFLRTLVFQMLAIIVLPMLWEVDGIWWSALAAEIAAFVISTMFLLGKRKRYGYL